MLYTMFAANNILSRPINILAHANAMLFKHMPGGQQLYAGSKLVERFTREYPRPDFDLGFEDIVLQKPFCDLVEFGDHDPNRKNILLVAPMSGHYATLLRGTAEEFMKDHNVFITDWHDASCVPMSEGYFGMNEYIEYLCDFFEYFNGDVHVIAVCQPSVPVVAAVSYLSMNERSYVPKSMTLMGGPIDTRENPTEVNEFAKKHDLAWFKQNVIYPVPNTKEGRGRRVYPGFLQLAGFMSMNLERHMTAHNDYFNHLCEGDGDSVEQHEKFYDEYLSVMDLDADFYLSTIETVFLEHHLPDGKFNYDGVIVDPSMIKHTALLTVEGEKDDITGRGQTKAAHDICTNVPHGEHFEAPGVGHYGIFNGRRFREQVAPTIRAFIEKISK